VYAPAKNEERNVRDWFASTAGADEVVLVDTGSTDGTLAVAATIDGLKVRTAVISPWRFDDGFNAALSQLSADIDIAVPLHLDERLQPGWREELEAAWRAGGRSFRFNYQWHESATFTLDRIHARHGFRWVFPAHECVVGLGPTMNTGLVIVHQRDLSKDRSQDRALIHLMLAENPENPRAQYYDAREYYYHNEWDTARRSFQVYLANPKAVFGQERSEACRFMARMAPPGGREAWLLRAAAEAPQRREPWADLCMYYTGVLPEAAPGIARRVLSIAEQTPDNSFFLESWAWNNETFHAIAATDLG
jgi:glycosyltransferase involved in cell wall biosynthesis